MRHDLTLEGPAFCLRPITIDDSAFIVLLRSLPERTVYLSPVMGSLEGQHRWYEEYSKRPGDWYFAIERKSSRKIEGTVAIYGFDPDANNAEWGRWILIPRSLAAIESALLIYRAAFDELDLSEVYCRTLVENEHSVSFHNSCGLALGSPSVFSQRVRDSVRKVTEHRLARARWPQVEERLVQLSERVAERL